MSSTSGLGSRAVSSRRSTRHFPADDEAVAEIIGSILMVGMTVVISLGLVALLIWSNPGPSEPLHASLSLELDPGPDGNWASGDERVRIHHLGGEPVPLNTTRISVDINGQTTTYSASGSDALQHSDNGAFSATNYEMTIGESWQTPLDLAPIQNGRSVHVNLVTTQGDGAVAWSSAGTTGTIDCDTDETAPFVATWNQTPSDVSTGTTETVDVWVTVIDACDNLDTSTHPHLEWRLDDGSSPAFTDQGAMAFKGDGRWNLTIPEDTWATHHGKSLEYRVTGMADTEGNVASPSKTQRDTIQLAGTSTFVTVPFDARLGTVTNDAAARIQGESNEAELHEGTNGTQGLLVTSTRLDANTVVAPGPFASPLNGFVSDNQFATVTQSGGPTDLTPIRYGFEDQGTNPGPIVSVVLRAELKTSDAAKSNWNLALCLDTDCSTDNNVGSTTADDVYFEFNATSQPTHPRGNASWSWSDIDKLEAELTARKTGGGSVTFSIDHVEVVVEYKGPGGQLYNMNIHGTMEGLSGTTHFLDLRYRVSGDTYLLWIWDGTQWTQETTLTDTLPTRYTVPLDADEVNAGEVRVRFTDSSNDLNDGFLYLDYLKVVSS